MESRLAVLTEGNLPQYRKQWAEEWKKRGGKVIGFISTYVPEETIHAAGMLSWRIAGTWDSDVSSALGYRPVSSNVFCTHVLQSYLAGELDFLDGMVVADEEQDITRLGEICDHVGRLPFVHILHVPQIQSELAVKRYELEINRLLRAFEERYGTQIDNQDLLQSIYVHNEMRSLLYRLYNLRKQAQSPVTGAEVMGIVLSATIMPKPVFIEKLNQLLPYLENIRQSRTEDTLRLMISGDYLDNPRFIQFIEDLDCVVAMDDLDTGSRYFSDLVDTRLSDPIYALASRYLRRPGGPSLCDWEKQAAATIRWVKEYRIDGLLQLPVLFSMPRHMRSPLFSHMLSEADIPNMSFDREYAMGNVGQIQTRIEAFLEMLRVRGER